MSVFIFVWWDYCDWNWNFEDVRFGHDLKFIDHCFLFVNTQSLKFHNNLSRHTRGYWSSNYLINSKSLIRGLLNCNFLSQHVLIFDWNRYLINNSSSNSSKIDSWRQYIQRPFQRIIQNACDHRIRFSNQLIESLLLWNSIENHLMLSLLSDRLDVGSDHVGSHGHWTDFVPSVCDCFSCDEFFVHFGVYFWLEGRFDKWDVGSEFAGHVEFLCFHHVIFFSFEQSFIVSSL